MPHCRGHFSRTMHNISIGIISTPVGIHSCFFSGVSLFSIRGQVEVPGYSQRLAHDLRNQNWPTIYGGGKNHAHPAANLGDPRSGP